MVKINFKKTHKDAQLPELGKEGSTGYDIYCVEGGTVPAKGSVVIPTGITVAYITPGYWFKVEPRSGLGFKSGIQPHLGVIDQPYRGDLGVKLYNFSDKDLIIEKGDRIAQMVIYPLINAEIDWSDEVEQTSRGADGFGSSGK